jgi:DNA modification methylase
VLRPRGSLFINLGDTYRHKSLLGIPWRVALDLMERGYLLRNANVWHKPNPLPSGVRDRMTTTYEFVFHFTKSSSYYFNLDAVRVAYKTERRAGGPGSRPPVRPGTALPGPFVRHPRGRNPTDVWTIPADTRPKPYLAGGVKHYAPYPEALCERPVLAACPRGGIVLDPFAGSGTTAVVACRLGRQFLGIEISGEYVAMARRRLELNKPPTGAPRGFPSGSRRGSGQRPVTGRIRSKGALSFPPDLRASR